MLLAKQKYMAFKILSKTIAGRLVRLSTKRSYEKGKRMNESVSERFDRLSKKRKSQQRSREFKITKYDMEAVSHQITDNNQSDGSVEEFSFNRLKRELNLYGYSTSSNAVSVKRFLSSITEGPIMCVHVVIECCTEQLCENSSIVLTQEIFLSK